jgi:hypothetical protein
MIASAKAASSRRPVVAYLAGLLLASPVITPAEVLPSLIRSREGFGDLALLYRVQIVSKADEALPSEYKREH